MKIASRLAFVSRLHRSPLASIPFASRAPPRFDHCALALSAACAAARRAMGTRNGEQDT